MSAGMAGTCEQGVTRPAARVLEVSTGVVVFRQHLSTAGAAEACCAMAMMLCADLCCKH